MDRFYSTVLKGVDASEGRKEFPLYNAYDCHRPIYGGGNPADEVSSRSRHSLTDALVASAEANGDLQVMQLEPISIKPKKRNPQIVNVKQTFRFPDNLVSSNKCIRGNPVAMDVPPFPPAHREMSSQTSKTILELYEEQRREQGLREIFPNRKADCLNALSSEESVVSKAVRRSSRGNRPLRRPPAIRPVEMVVIKPAYNRRNRPPRSRRRYTRTICSHDYFASAIKSPVLTARKLKLPTLERRPLPPVDTEEDVSDGGSEVSVEQKMSSTNDSSQSLELARTKNFEVQLASIVDGMHDEQWTVKLQAIRQLARRAAEFNWERYDDFVTIINRKLIEFLRSPRTAVCRYACMAAGEMFKQTKSTRRPEFDEIVDILLCKTADPSRCVQHEAHVALDKLVKFIPLTHAIRALSTRGPMHRNPMVRTSTARLVICTCALYGLDALVGGTASPRTRKTIMTMLARFLLDKHLETKKHGEKIYKILRKHRSFNKNFFKDVDSAWRGSLERALKEL